MSTVPPWSESKRSNEALAASTYSSVTLPLTYAFALNALFAGTDTVPFPLLINNLFQRLTQILNKSLSWQFGQICQHLQSLIFYSLL